MFLITILTFLEHLTTIKKMMTSTIEAMNLEEGVVVKAPSAVMKKIALYLHFSQGLEATWR